jgi:hypothetical protein
MIFNVLSIDVSWSDMLVLQAVKNPDRLFELWKLDNLDTGYQYHITYAMQQYFKNVDTLLLHIVTIPKK